MDIFSIKTLVVLLFVLTYLLIILFYHKKTYFVWSTVLIIMLVRVLSPIEAIKSINWNVMGIFVGMLFVSEMFIYSKTPDVLAERIVSKSKRIWIAMLGVCLFSGILSAVTENVAVVLIIAPIAIYIAKKLDINPVPLVIGIAVSSNLQGVATMIGDPPSLLLAAYAGLTFNDFFIFDGKPSLFFAVQLAAIASLIVLYFFFKKYKETPIKIEPEKIRSKIPGLSLVLMILCLIIVSFFEYHGSNTFLSILNANKIGLICFIFGVFVWLWYYTVQKRDFLPMVKRLDWDSALFLAGIFVIVQSLISVNFMTSVAEFIGGITSNNVFLAFNIIVWTSVIFSGFVDNVPFIAAMLPVVGSLSDIMGVSPYLLFFGLVIGASVGGNITPVGAAANIVACGFLKKNGYKTTFWDFVKIGLPFTVVSVVVSTMFIWFVFS